MHFREFMNFFSRNKRRVLTITYVREGAFDYLSWKEY